MHTSAGSEPRLPLSTPAAEAYAARAAALSVASGAKPSFSTGYGPAPAQRLEVFEPAAPAGSPVLVFLHGGAWTHGGLDWLRFMAPAVTALPAVFMAVSYRLAPEHRWPACFEDACRALDRVRELALQRGYDPARVVVSGHSAGGHLASLAVLRLRPQWARACFPVSTRFDLRHADPAPGSGEERVYKLLLSDAAQDADASPLLHVDGNTVPFHLTWGDRDFERVSSSSVAMAGALRARGMPVTEAVVAGADHFQMHLQLADPANDWYARLQKAFEAC